MPKDVPLISRRTFLGQASCAAVGSASLFSTLLNLRMASSAAAQGLPIVDPLEYRALVCLFLSGGNDSYNMLVPRGNTEYGEYAAIRGDLALPQEDLLAINPLNDLQGKQLGVHPSMPEVRELFDDGRLAFVTNVGTLIQPTSLSEYENGTVPLPRGLYSHADQADQWQTSVPDSGTGFGWGGRTADLLNSLNNNDRISMNISLNGNNLWQSGQNTVQYQITPSGSIARTGYDDAPGSWNAMVGAAIDSQLDLEYANLFEQTFAGISRGAIDAHEEFSAATALVPPFTAQVVTDPATDTADEIEAIHNLADHFAMVARTIAAHGTLGQRRQTFFINIGGWDHHDEVLDTQASMLKVVSRCLAYFDALMTEIRMSDKVTLFTASDFARTLSSNGRGSDHAWGGNQMVLGGAVKGQTIYGDYPDLYAGNGLDTGRGRLIPTLSVDQYFAEMAAWLGVSSGDLTTVLPNLGRFHTPGNGAPVGFLL